MSPPAAAATSLVVVFLNATSGSVSYLRSGRVDVPTGIILAVATIPGALLGPALAERMPQRAFQIAFGLLMLAMSAFLFLRPEAVPAATLPREPRRWRLRRSFTDRVGTRFEYSYSLPLAIIISLGVGILATMLGIGGGIVHVPAMIHLMGFPVHVATATSFFVLAITALAGVLEYASRGHIVWALAFPLGAGVVIGAQMGAWVSHRLHGRRIIRLLVIAVVILAGRLLWGAWRA